VQSVLLLLHHTTPGDLSDTSFTAPNGFAQAAVCAGPAETPHDACSRTLLTWLPDGAPTRPDGAPARAGGAPTRASPSAQDAPVADAAVALSVVTPEAGSRVWRNPESPPAANQLVLRAKTTPHVPQIVWYVDGAPFALTDPDVPVTWPLVTGEHRFAIGLPLRPELSRPVRLEVQ
jgi:penicillin-binding protein 1C